jgi:predicted Holliday junction resolvase-like endonuclease
VKRDNVKERKKAREMIRTLERDGFYGICPCCDEPMRLSDCGLFYLDEFGTESKEVFEQMQRDLEEAALEFKRRRKQVSFRSEVGAKAVNIGFIFERLAPSLPSFRFERNDCRSLFDPIDYIIFEGLSSKGSVSRILFSDIKTGKASLQSKQKEIKAAVNSKKVSLLTYEQD